MAYRYHTSALIYGTWALGTWEHPWRDPRASGPERRARCPMPVGRCPMPVARCPLPGARGPPGATFEQIFVDFGSISGAPGPTFAKKTRAGSVLTPKKLPFRFSIAFSSIVGCFLKVPTLVSCGQGHTKATFPFFAKVAKKVTESRARTSENRPKIDKNRPKVAPGGPRAPTATQKRRATGNRRRATGTGSVPSRNFPLVCPQVSC